LALCIALATSRLASANVEIGGTAGLHLFSDKDGLGIPKNIEGTSMAETLKNSAFFAFRVGIFFGAIGVEGEAGMIPSEPSQMAFDVFVTSYRAHVAYMFRAADPDSLWLPFVEAGAGMMSVVDSRNKGVAPHE